MPIDPEDFAGSGGPDLETWKPQIGDSFKGTVIDADYVPHLSFETKEQEYNAAGKPKKKLVMRLRPAGATDPSEDIKWWTQNQVKFEVEKVLGEHFTADTYRGAKLTIKRLPDAEPRVKGYRGAAQFEITLLTPGPANWVDPLAAAAAPDLDLDLDAF